MKRMGNVGQKKKIDRSRRQTRKFRKRMVLLIVCIGIALIMSAILFRCLKKESNADNDSVQVKENPISRPDLDVKLLTVNEYSRPGTPLEKITGIVIHYTANPGATAIQNRNYFEGLKDVKTTKASSHFIIGLDGEIVQCIPSSEISYASNSKNNETLSIECCHKDETGELNEKTYKSLVQLTSWLCVEFHVDPDQIIRHYDITGKRCPKYYVDHPEKWDQFKEDVKEYIASAEN